MSKLYPVIAIDHEDGETVYCWGKTSGVETVRHCLKEHPEQSITVRQIAMAEEEFEALDDYDGDC
jgi:hypothetical protein